ncbi:hypothetical protein T310_9120, partial [Rasamsonia emersonii CBS 393.64]
QAAPSTPLFFFSPRISRTTRPQASKPGSTRQGPTGSTGRARERKPYQTVKTEAIRGAETTWASDGGDWKRREATEARDGGRLARSGGKQRAAGRRRQTDGDKRAVSSEWRACWRQTRISEGNRTGGQTRQADTPSRAAER